MQSTQTAVTSGPELVKEKIATSDTRPRIQTNAERRLDRCKNTAMAAYFEHCQQASELNFRAIAITLTYASASTFAARNISQTLMKMRAWLKRRGFPLLYIWTLEVSSVIHYHLMVWLPRTVFLEPKMLTGWWPHGATWIASCRKPRRWARYIAKRETKDMQRVPKNTRMYGIGGFDEEGKACVRWALLPKWLRDLTTPDQNLRRLSGVGWVDTDSGETYRSPWTWCSGRWKYLLY